MESIRFALSSFVFHLLLLYLIKLNSIFNLDEDEDEFKEEGEERRELREEGGGKDALSSFVFSSFVFSSLLFHHSSIITRISVVTCHLIISSYFIFSILSYLFYSKLFTYLKSYVTQKLRYSKSCLSQKLRFSKS